MRTPFVAGNWKMNTTLTEAVDLARQLVAGIDGIPGVQKVICPPFISLASVKDVLSGSSIELGAQNCYFEQKGAFTGEIAASMLTGLCRFVILGHSERRHYFSETDALVSLKIAAALKNNLDVIACVGENLTDYDRGQTAAVVSRQIAGSLAGVPDLTHLTIAYEPVWAIGTGRAATGPQAAGTIQMIRLLLAQKYGAEAAGHVRILYGGSVTAANIAEFVSEPDIDGALVGGASLKAQEFTSIVSITAKTRLR